MSTVGAAASRDVQAGVPVRLRVRMVNSGLHDKCLEVFDWQFLQEGGTAWGRWFSEIDYIGIDFAIKAETEERRHDAESRLLTDALVDATGRGLNDFLALSQSIETDRKAENAKNARQREEIKKAWDSYKLVNALDRVAAATRPATAN